MTADWGRSLRVCECLVCLLSRARVCVCVCVCVCAGSRRLDSNALVCDCGLMWMSELLSGSHLQAAVTCQQPSSLAGKSLASVLDDIVCRKSRYTTLLGQLSLTSLRGRLIEYQLWLG